MTRRGWISWKPGTSLVPRDDIRRQTIHSLIKAHLIRKAGICTPMFGTTRCAIPIPVGDVVRRQAAIRMRAVGYSPVRVRVGRSENRRLEITQSPLELGENKPI